MTIGELIEELNKVDDKSIIVFTKGYEGGVDGVNIESNDDGSTRVLTVDLNVNTEWYYGQHEITEDDTPLIENKIVKGILLR